MAKKSIAELVTLQDRRLCEMDMLRHRCPVGIRSLRCRGAFRPVLALLLATLSSAVGCVKTNAAPAIPAPEVEVDTVVQKDVPIFSEWDRERGYYMKQLEDISTNIEIAVDHSGADAIVRLKGRIDVDSSPDVRDHLQAVLSRDPLPHAVYVDLGGVTSIEASGIATLIEALKVARHREIRFQLQGHGSVFQLFESAGLLALFDTSSGGNGAS